MLPQILTVNPMAKRRRHAHKKRAHNRFRFRARHRSHNPHRSRRSRHRIHNPFSIKGLSGSVMPALIGAGGAVLTDVSMAYAAPYLPASLQSGWLNILTRAAAAIGVGFIAGKVAGKQIGKEVAAGGLIVVAYSGLKQALAPTLGNSIKGLSGLADFGDYRPAVAYGNEAAAMTGEGMGAYMQPRMGAYMQPRLGAYMNPAAFVTSGAAASPVRQMQRAMAGFGAFGGGSGFDSESM